MIDLRNLTRDDADQLFAWRTSPEVSRWMCDAFLQDPEGHRRWIDSFLQNPDRRGWVISHNGRPAGFLALTGVASPHKRAEWGWYIGEAEARGRGVGRAAQALGLDRAFDELGLEKVWAEVMAGNDAALKAQTSAGFRREGYLRKHVFKEGRFQDVVLLAILAEEWRARRDAVRRDLAGSHLIAA